MNGRYGNENAPLRRKPSIHRVRSRAPAQRNQNLPPSVISGRRGRIQRNPVNSARRRQHDMINAQLSMSAEDMADIQAAHSAGIQILGILSFFFLLYYRDPNGLLFDVSIDCESANSVFFCFALS